MTDPSVLESEGQIEWFLESKWKIESLESVDD